MRAVFGEVPTVAVVPRFYRRAAEGSEGAPVPPQDRVKQAAGGAERGHRLVVPQDLNAEDRLLVTAYSSLLIPELKAQELGGRL